MSRVDELIEALMEEYFDEDNTCERYKIFDKVEKAMKEARAVTREQIEHLEDFRAEYNKAEYVEDEEEILLKRMSKAVSDAAGTTVLISRSLTMHELGRIGLIDSLDMVELVMLFEEILGVDVDTDGGIPDPDMTIGDILDLRK